ncbi:MULTISPECIES: DMT family transporter [Fictibacillus]|uniref:EamA domain-containing protein n=1 Tax=Fictibacillus enclensis TaxID=1017270 RepID=A0A0V8JBP9_9BACL|nr:MULTISPECIES: DMT family transporter [Fictibacillus]KSU84615.1 hypothetical protein AS030_03490 [Fictibacillus enclensis]RXY99738.1 EamA/RhaT family transporter [Fictibacillus sp. S7]SCB82431.1 Permease of the drug/metabolite transporter (DMT) superfamily [Fictibacillus enclensis]
MIRLYGALVGLSLIWGLSFVFMKWLLEPAGIWGVVFIRTLAGAIILLPLVLRKTTDSTKKLPIKWLLITGFFNCGLAWGLISLSETVIQSNTASILNATTPIWTGLLGFFLFSYRLNKQQWIGILIGFFGILVLMDFQIGHLFGAQFVGIGTMVLAAICYGLSGQLTKRYLSGVGVVTITFFTLLTGAATGLVGVLLTEPVHIGQLLELKPMLAVLGLGCLGSGLGQLIYFYLNKNGSPEFAATVTYLIPASAMIWGYVLLKEPVTPNLIVGLLIIFAGVYLSSKKKRNKETLTTIQKKEASR